MKNELKKEFAAHVLDALNDGRLHEVSEIHHVCFNEDYYIIGYFEAEQWLMKHSTPFEAIGEVKEYENSNFGQVTTDFSSSEKVANMYAYIKGEEFLNSIDAISDNWDENLEDCEGLEDKLHEELESILND
jgi:hypothetical protein